MMNLFVDCGAYTGDSIAKWMATHKHGYDYVCFEPNRTSAKIIRHAFPSVKVIEACAWRNYGEHRLYPTAHANGGTVVGKKKRGVDSYMVNTVDLGDWLDGQRKEYKKIVVKLNVEGAEYDILRSMQAHDQIRLVDEWYINWHANKMTRAPKDHAEIRDMMKCWPEWDNAHSPVGIYTAIIGDGPYCLREDFKREHHIDYICYTDRQDIKSDVWEIRRIKKQKHPILKSREIKILCHRWMPGYEYSVWMDTRFVPFYKHQIWINHQKASDAPLVVMDHNKRRCALEDLRVLGLKSSRQYNLYKKDLPEKFGLWAPGIMVRRHDDARLAEAMEFWYNEIVEEETVRDQPALAYTLYKTGVPYRSINFRKCYDKWIGRS